MKKLFLAFALLTVVAGVTEAQTNSRAIGARFGWGGELSYQHPLSGSTRLEADLGLGGWDHGGFLLSGIHQWLWNIDGGLDWYLGVGPQLGSVWYKDKDKEWQQGFGLGVAGQIGIEYNLPIPLQISLDYRPSWFIIPSARGFAYEGVALGLRYRF